MLILNKSLVIPMLRFLKLTNWPWVPFNWSVARESDRPVINSQYWLDPSEHFQLREELEALYEPWHQSLGVSSAQQQGNIPSRALGSGFEYAESQAYQPGDDIRFLDWRLMAKKQQAFTKWFEPERLENWCLVLDESASMRFGTRTRLKVQQACRAIGSFAFLSEKRQSQLRLMRFSAQNKEIAYSPVWTGRNLFEQAMAFVSNKKASLDIEKRLQNASQSHLADSVESEVNAFNTLLQSIPQDLPAGSKLVFVSDFHALHKHAAKVLNHLSFLAQTFQVMAVVVEDMAERELPQNTGLELVNLQGKNPVSLDAQQQLNYSAWANRTFDERKSFMQACGVKVIEWRTDEKIGELLQRLKS